MGYLEKFSGSDAARLAFSCPWCMVAAAAAVLKVADRYYGGPYYAFAACPAPHCGKGVMAEINSPEAVWSAVCATDRVRIIPGARPEYRDKEVPSAIATEFEQALQCQAAGYILAAALVGRRVLQAAVRHSGGTGNNLFEEIDSLEDAKLSSSMKEHAHQVRLIGNEAAHVESVSIEDADDLLVFAREILYTLFIMPARLAASKARRSTKLPSQ